MGVSHAFHQLAGCPVKPANYDGLQFLKYDDLFKARRNVLLVWMKHLLEAYHPAYADVEFVYDIVKSLEEVFSIFKHIPSVETANFEVREVEPKHRSVVKAIPSNMSSSTHRFDVKTI
jgi:hypothetical protein